MSLRLQVGSCPLHVESVIHTLVDGPTSSYIALQMYEAVLPAVTPLRETMPLGIAGRGGHSVVIGNT